MALSYPWGYYPSMDLTTAPLPPVVRAPTALRRQVLVGAVIAPLAWLVLTSAGGGMTTAPVLWLILVGAASVLGAASLATYVPGPGAGWKPVWGCGPCSIVALTSLPAAAIVLHGSPWQTSAAVIAMFVNGLGLVQRLRDPKACPARPSA